MCGVVGSLMVAPAACAQATRTWVSGVGDDANPCSRTAPCKTFAGAISKTAAGGEISALDPAGYGVVTITKAIMINGDGTLAGILASLSNGVIVNAGANDRVVLRNLSINGAGNGINGIRFLAGRQLTVDNVTISGFTNHGIDMALTTGGFAYIKDTRITHAVAGVRVNNAGAGFGVATLDNVRLEHLTNGIDIAANARVVIRNSVLSGSSSNGVLLSTASSVGNIDNCVFSFNNLNGLALNAAGATARVTRSSFFNNSIGIGITAGTVHSDGSNVFGGNSVDGAPNGAALVKQ
jgi:hypothetical protein